MQRPLLLSENTRFSDDDIRRRSPERSGGFYSRLTFTVEITVYIAKHFRGNDRFCSRFDSTRSTNDEEHARRTQAGLHTCRSASRRPNGRPFNNEAVADLNLRETGQRGAPKNH